MIHPTLEQLRTARGFEVAEVSAAKIGRLTHWLRSENLDAAVVGVSGGVDSALVLALLRGAQESGALRRVIALLLPIEARGATNQAEATSRGRRAAAALGAEIWEAPLAAAHGALVGSLAQASGLAFDAWSEGQALAVVRTPALYGAAALLQAHGLRSIIIATRFALARDADEDVLDARDFLLGADEGGLVVALPGGETARAIYALPFVDPAVRASMRATGGAGGAHVDPHAFSRAIWSLNARTFEGSPLAVRDLPSPARALLRQASTPDDMLLSAYCAERAATL